VTSREPLVEIEIEALNRVGLNPQNLPSSLDDYIRLYLRDKAEVDVSPASSSDLVGSGTAAFAAGFASGIVKGGATGVGTALTTGNIKKQTGVQEWIHWKKYALDRPDFEEYRKKESERYERMLDTMTTYIRSRKGEVCCKYEAFRPGMRAVFGLATYCTFGIAYLVVVAIKNHEGNSEITLIEWLIQKVFKLQPFSSVRPRGEVNEYGELVLEY